MRYSSFFWWGWGTTMHKDLKLGHRVYIKHQCSFQSRKLKLMNKYLRPKIFPLTIWGWLNIFMLSWWLDSSVSSLIVSMFWAIWPSLVVNVVYVQFPCGVTSICISFVPHVFPLPSLSFYAFKSSVFLGLFAGRLFVSPMFSVCSFSMFPALCC